MTSDEILREMQRMQEAKIAFVQRQLPGLTRTQAILVLFGGWTVLKVVVRWLFRRGRKGCVC